FLIFFFFSSRRRHTRFSRDWSSDVCSSDLGVTHFCGAPIVLNSLLNAPEEHRRKLQHSVKAMTAGAAPPAAVIAGVEAMGIEVTHVYGLTETYGPSTVCA